MKNILIYSNVLLAAAALVAFVPLPVLAEDVETVEAKSALVSGRHSGVFGAGNLIGMTVRNSQDEIIGKVENLMIDLETGRVVAVVVDSGDYLEIKNELSSLPASALRFAKGRESLLLETSKARLAAAPHFNSANWPDFSQPAYAAALKAAYPQGAAVEPDNANRNKGDEAPTPMDQGEGKADIETTAQIRREVMAMKDLSLTAKNVKIITKGGKVCLRGPVNSEAERTAIGASADRAVRAENVDNQLEVIPAP